MPHSAPGTIRRLLRPDALPVSNGGAEGKEDKGRRGVVEHSHAAEFVFLVGYIYREACFTG